MERFEKCIDNLAQAHAGQKSRTWSKAYKYNHEYRTTLIFNCNTISTLPHRDRDENLHLVSDCYL